MEYIIKTILPIALMDEVERAAKSLELSLNSYLQEALREKIDDWIRNRPSKKTSLAKQDCVTVSAKLSEELLSQIERAAADFDLSVDAFTHQALQEKVNRLPQDIVHKEKMDRAIEHIFEKNGEVFRRLAEWPATESASR